MKKPPLDPNVADVAPTNSALTTYDEEHIITYLRLLDADAEGIHRSRIFPGLWLDGKTLLAGDMVAVLATLQQGLDSRAHKDFVKELARRRKKAKS